MDRDNVEILKENLSLVNFSLERQRQFAAHVSNDDRLAGAGSAYSSSRGYGG